MSNDVIGIDKRIRAEQLQEQIIIYAHQAQDAIFNMGRALNDMKEEELYIELGYSDFEDYCYSKFELKKSQAYKYISIYRNLGEGFISQSGNIGLTKLYLLSQITEDEREELSGNADIEEVSVKELKEQIEKMKKDKELLQCSFFEMEKKKDAAVSEAEKLKKETEESKKLKEKISKLEKKIKDQEEKPIDVAASEPDPNEVEKRAAEIAEEKLKREQKTHETIVSAYEKKVSEVQDKLKKKESEQEALKEDYEKRLASVMDAAASAKAASVSVPASKDQFKVFLQNALTIINNALTFANSAGADSKFYRDALKSALLKAAEKIG